jgi:hypothetical protein
MTPEEAADLLGVDVDAPAASVIAAYSAKAAEAKATNTGDPDTEAAELRLLSEARVTLMSYQHQEQGRQQRATAAQSVPSSSAPPKYGERSTTPETRTTASGWPELAGSTSRLSSEDEQRRKKRTFIIAIIAVLCSLSSWFTILALPVTLVGIGLGIMTMVRVRGFGGGMYTGTRVLFAVNLIVGIFAIAGCVLILITAFGHH